MTTLLTEIHFWTLKNDVYILDTDFSAFKYNSKKDSTGCSLRSGKKIYTEQRGHCWSVSNKRPVRLKESLKEFEDYLEHVKTLHIEWRDSNRLLVVFNNGLLVHIGINTSTGDVQDIIIDKFMNGKLLYDYVSDVAVTGSKAFFTYADKQLTVVNFAKPFLRHGSGRKWGTLDAKIQTVELVGSHGKRAGRKMSYNTSQDMLLIWWKTSRDDIYPWSPEVKEIDRANVHVYGVRSGKFELVCYYSTEFEPVLIKFSDKQSNIIHSVQQKLSSKGEVTLEWSKYEINRNVIEQRSVTSLLLPTHCSALAVNPAEDKLLVACIDGSLLITDAVLTDTTASRAAFIPTLVSWHPDSCIILVANERAQFQCFDCSLCPLRIQQVHEDSVSSPVLDLNSYFNCNNRYPPSLMNIMWNHEHQNDVTDPDSYLLLWFERGPLGVLRIVEGRKQLNHLSVISEFVKANEISHAVDVLVTLDWESQGSLLLSSLQTVVTHLLKFPLNPEKEELLERALACYHSPKRPLSNPIDQEVGDAVHDLTRRFFHHLLRYKVFDKALRLAIDLSNYDLFMDVHSYCTKIGLTDMAQIALEKAEELSETGSSVSGSWSRECSSSCSCSQSSCSCCWSGSRSGSSDGRPSPEPRKVPPLPVVGKLPLPVPRQKVQFSNTVTHIPLRAPEVQELLPMSEEVSVMNTVGLPIVDDIYSYPVSLPITSTTSQHQNGQPPQEPSKIKVVHFGLV